MNFEQLMNADLSSLAVTAIDCENAMQRRVQAHEALAARLPHELNGAHWSRLEGYQREAVKEALTLDFSNWMESANVNA